MDKLKFLKDPVAESPLRDELFNMEQLILHAKGLASQQELAKNKKDHFLLTRLNYNDKILREFNKTTLLLKKHHNITPATTWLVDNFYLIEEQVQLARIHFPPKYSEGLPCLASGLHQGFPRIYSIILELVSHVDAQIDEDSIQAFVDAYQAQSQLKLGELWAIPIMLRLALIENLQRITLRLQENQLDRDKADYWIEKLEFMAKIRPSRLIEVVSDMAKSNIVLSSAFVAEFCQRMSSQNIALHIARSWLEQRLSELGLSIEELIHTENQNQAANQLSVSYTINSFRTISTIDWKEFVEKISFVEKILRNDPAQIYPLMDFTTRDHYRHSIERLARKSAYSESEVAQQMVKLSEIAKARHLNSRNTHVGFYLVDDGQRELNQTLNVQKTMGSIVESTMQRHPFFFYSGGIISLSAIGSAGFVKLLLSQDINITDCKLIILLLVFLLFVSQLAVDLVNWISMSLIKPKMLPRLDFSKGIPRENATVVVVPTMLSSIESIDNLIDNLELHYLSNRDGNLYFALLTDLTDSQHELTPQDKTLEERAKRGIKKLNDKYATTTNPSIFYLFHRPRHWNTREAKWMGHERKRGKLMEFNAFLTNGSTNCFSKTVGDISFLSSIKYVITLDSDTLLPGNTAHKLIGTMAHPLNHPEFDPKRRIVVRGYGILQPRVAINLQSSQSSMFTRLISNDAGIDPYTRAISDVYQDIFREGSYVGKGIYDVAAFEKALGGRFPENKILSHDLLESAYVRSALISDVEMYETYPQGYNQDAVRRHRWIRGDWQIIQWLLPRVPLLNGKWEKNPISKLAKWKLIDNLRRSLLPSGFLLFLMLSCSLSPRSIWLIPFLVAAIVLLPLTISLFTSIISKPKEQLWHLHIREVLQKGLRQFNQILFSLILLPYEAYLNTSAILSGLSRLLFTHRHLLEWKTAMSSEKTLGSSLFGFYYLMWFAPTLTILCSVALAVLNPMLMLYSSPLWVVWLASPAISWFISRPNTKKDPDFTEKQKILLGRITRKTWHFFETFVTEKENWLPPDNFQEIPFPVVASRTSPTNMGLSLLANLSALDFGYISTGNMLHRTRLALEGMSRLKRYKNHFYNWYDTRTLEPLSPLYVSSVDSGNLAGHLLTLTQGLNDLKDSAIYTPNVFEGLKDTILVLKEHGEENRLLTEVEKMLSAKPKTLKAAFSLLEVATMQIDKVIESFDPQNSILHDWGQRLKKQCEEHILELTSAAPWLIMQHTAPREATVKGFNSLIIEIEKLDSPLTLKQMARLGQTISPLVESALKNIPESDQMSMQYLSGWLLNINQAVDHSQKRIELIDSLIQQAELFSKMDFVFLYDSSKKLFTIGYNVTEQRSDKGSYDMLASEARLCSYVAISQGQVPQEHWFSLSRLLFITEDKPVLLSWSGSMFEYLMPLLVMPNFKQTLLDKTYTGAVHVQIEYGKTLGVPWGISESGYNRTDTSLNYQYKAFGIPSLGLKRGLSKDLVITPYATVMALMVAPIKACENLERLTNKGHEGEYGYYEAIDYTPSHLPPGESSVNVHSFMVHHQAMSLLALTNLKKDNVMQRRFMACPILKANELLLQERVPRSISANIISDDSEYEIKGIHPLLSDTSGTIRRFEYMNIAPEVNLLSNGRYQTMVNNSGGGYSRWNGMAVTRWREDATSDNLGLFVYIRDKDDAKFHSNTYQPVLSEVSHNEATFTQAYAEFHQKESKLEVFTTICISPEDDVELRRIRLINHSSKERTIELTTYSEVVIAPQAADEAHPSFSNLFVQTEFVPASSALFCTRRPRSEDEMKPCLIHLLLADYDQSKEISCETDRSLFVGRGGNLKNPLAMKKRGSLSNSQGSVLDPAIALRRTVTIAPNSATTVCVVLGMAETYNEAISLTEKYQNTRMTERAFELAWTHSQIILHQLNITEAEAQLYSKLAGSLVYANPFRRASQSRLKNNRKTQDRLWSYGISGDTPLVLIRIADISGIELVRQLVLAHAYWRIKGLTVELVILNEDVSIYRQSVRDEIVNLISSGIEAPLLEKTGGIFVRHIEQVPHDDLLLLLAAARIVLNDEYGTLTNQLESLDINEVQVPAFNPTLMPVPTGEKPLAARKLILENGIGGFTPEGHEYVITLSSGQTTPAPWCNVLANEQLGTVVSESGGAYTWAENAHEFRLTPWNNDPVKDSSGEAFYIRDEQTGQYWSPTPLPAKGSTPYIIRHGFGYTVFEHSENGIESEFVVYVAVDAAVKFSVLKLRNVSGRNRKISVTGYYEWVLADIRTKGLLHIQTEIDGKTGAFSAQNYYNIGFTGQIAFIDVGDNRTLTGDRTEFIGRNGSLSEPAAMKRTRLSGKVGAGFDPCGAMQVMVELADGQEKKTIFRLGFAHTKEEMRDLVSRFRRTGAASEALSKVRSYWNKTLGAVNVDTPDPSVNVMANGWLLYQTISSRIWARSGYYQSGGAYGFRDQLQDVMALVHASPSLIRQQILLAASRQFKEGDVQHWWHPPMGRGVRTHFSDDYLWLPYVVERYTSSVGDIDILNEEIPFIEGRLLGANEESYYDLPGRSGEVATLYEHCVRSIRHGLKFGQHGLPLMGCGDWNDGMNMVGKEGQGESVWLGFFLYDVLLKFSTIATSRNDGSFAQYCRQQAEQLRINIRQNAWDGEWYRRAYFDDGTPLGSISNEECRIDSLPQSWSVISGGGDPERSAAGMAQVEKQLIHHKDKLIQLFTPAFDKSDLHPGYIKGYIPGVRENGGQYTHGAIWTVLAFALLGESEKAWRLFDLLNPVHHGNTEERIAVYKVEPYVVAADVYAAEGHLGRGGWTWYTGSSAWMYRLLVETLLGINLAGNRLELSPHLPQKWNSYKVHYRYQETVYHISFRRISDLSSARLVLDGQTMDSTNILPLADDKVEHFAEMWIA